MVLLLAPNIISICFPKTRTTAVSMTAVKISRVKQFPSIFSASWSFFLPIIIAARGAPPIPARAANAVMATTTGIATPTPVSASAPAPSMCPMNILSTMLYRTFTICAVIAGRASLNSSPLTGAVASFCSSLFIIYTPEFNSIDNNKSNMIQDLFQWSLKTTF